MIRHGEYELFCDVGAIGPDYIPGHAHADTLSFVLYFGGKPLLIDPGVSTYEKNARRQEERGTGMHNTVIAHGKNSSDVWSGFRVGRRARVIECRQSATSLMAAHDGYRATGSLHRRTWIWDEPGRIRIEDSMGGGGVAYFHFHPEIEVVRGGRGVSAGRLDLFYENADRVDLESYECPDGFNKVRKAWRVAVVFRGRLTTIICSK